MDICSKQNQLPFRRAYQIPHRSFVPKCSVELVASQARSVTSSLMDSSLQAIERQSSRFLKVLLVTGLSSALSAKLLLCPSVAHAEPPLPAPTTEVHLRRCSSIDVCELISSSEYLLHRRYFLPAAINLTSEHVFRVKCACQLFTTLSGDVHAMSSSSKPVH